MAARQVSLGAITFANDAPFVLIGGVNVLESQQFALDAAAQYAEVCRKLSIPLVFKASFDQANRSSIHSFRGPGLTDGLAMLQAVKDTHGIPVITDVHTRSRRLRPPRCAHHSAAGIPGPSDGSGGGDGPHRRCDQHQEAAVSEPLRWRTWWRNSANAAMTGC